MFIPRVPDPPWKDAYHHLMQASMVVFGLYLGLFWPNLNIPLTLGLSLLSIFIFLFTLAYYLPMWCYTPTRFWVILAVGFPLYVGSGIIESINVVQMIPAIALMILADRLLNHLLAFFRPRQNR